MHLVLWDVDGTLMNSRGAIRHARSTALRSVYGIEGEIRRVAGGGMTDPQLTLETVALHGWTEESALAHLDAFRDAYLAGLEEARASLAADLEVLDGVRETIERLHARGVAQSLLTGNYEPAARLKVSAAGLDTRLDFALGAFGSDNRDRLCLVPVALEKAQRLLDPAMIAADIVVIGDSPRDIACARAGGARAVAVATGPHPAEELATFHPDALLERLHDNDETIKALLGR
ncbi:MAG: haloacid dehalogenase-like hydrolase [Chloroflexi bacterium]|nr:haloacid dehalogenase-like hydrolase [Chloroflexota bacterium]